MYGACTGLSDEDINDDLLREASRPSRLNKAQSKMANKGG